MDRRQMIQQALQAIGIRNKELKKQKGTWIREKYRHVPLLLKLLSDKKSLSRPELADLLKHGYILISHGQVIPSMQGYRHLYTYLLYLESTAGNTSEDYARVVKGLFGGSDPDAG